MCVLGIVLQCVHLRVPSHARRLQSKNGQQQVPLSTATVSMVHSVPELMVSSEQAEQLGREDQQRLHRNRKLVLMVDLDQTLIHTTEQHCQQMSNKVSASWAGLVRRGRSPRPMCLGWFPQAGSHWEASKHAPASWLPLGLGTWKP